MALSSSKSCKEGRLHLRIAPSMLEEMRRFAAKHSMSLSTWCMLAFNKALKEEMNAEGPVDAEQV